VPNNFYDREYDPKLNIPNYKEYFARWKIASVNAHNQSTAKLNLSYGPTDDETLDYFPAQQDKSPLLVFVHGGYWRAFNKSDFSWIARPYVASGISVAIINYGLAPQVALSEIVTQVRRSMTWLQGNSSELNFDPERIVYSGHSAGGHLTAMLLATHCSDSDNMTPTQPLRAVIAVSGIFDLEPISKAPFLQSDLRLDTETIRELSPVNLSPASDTPLFTVVGQLESNEFHRQSKLIQRRWGDSIVLGPIIIEGANHFDVCDIFADINSSLFQSTCSLCFGNPSLDIFG
tara:strand:+ start:6493 stop:7359 length:867 start_codon:yes stop_codon:yes gene_type:complete